MSWHLIEKILDEVSKQSTIFGKVWITLLFVFRVIAVTRIGDTLYSDEQAAFKCNTKQPGCENVCFNEFSPISHVRFWGFQIIIVATPAMMFIVYAAHAVSTIPVACKLAGGEVEMTKLKSSKTDYSKVSSGLECKTPLSEVIISTTRHPRRKNETTNGWKKKEYDAVNRWKVVAEPASELTNAANSELCRKNLEEQRSEPPAYREKSSAYFDEVSLKNLQLLDHRIENETNYRRTGNHLESNKERGSDRVYPQLSAVCEQIKLHHVRRYSDSDVTSRRRRQPSPRQPRRRSSVASPAHDLMTSPHYSVARLCHVDDIPEPNFVWQTKQRAALPMTMIHLTPKSDRDSAFSERLSLIVDSIDSAKSISSGRGRTSANRPISSPVQAIKSRPSALSKARFSPSPQHKRWISIADDKKSIASKSTMMKPAQSDCSNAKQSKRSSINTANTLRIQKYVKRVEWQIGFAYIAQCLMRLLLEGGFLFLQYFFFQFEVPELYKCQRWPCPNMVDCFISRPSEKSMMLYFMFGVTVLCIALTCWEIAYLIWRRSALAKEKRKLQKDSCNGSCDMRKHSFRKSHKLHRGKYDLSKHPYLLEGYSKLIRGYSVDMNNGSTATPSSKSTKSTRSETESDELEANSFNSEDLSSMFDNEAADIADFNNDQNEAAEFV